MEEGFTIPLSKLVALGDQEIKSLTLREPTGEDIAAAGVPLVFAADGTFRVDAAAMTALIARTSRQARTVIERLNARDWSACMRWLMPFFGEEGTPSPAPSTSRSSSA